MVGIDLLRKAAALPPLLAVVLIDQHFGINAKAISSFVVDPAAGTTSGESGGWGVRLIAGDCFPKCAGVTDIATQDFDRAGRNDGDWGVTAGG